MKIGVLDSGIGGLTVLSKIIKKVSGHEYYYLGDNKNAPYGDKTKKELIEITKKNIKIFILLNIKNIIIACNTLSTTLKDFLIKSYPFINFYFVYPYLTDISKNKLCYVLCTKKTAINLKKQNFNNKKLEIINCSGLVELIEKDLFNFSYQKLFEFLPKKEPQIIYLGCTHYPFIATSIKKVYKKAKILDGTQQILKEFNIVKEKKLTKIFFLGEFNRKNRQIFAFFEKKLQKVETFLL